jgi:hypothetical protein
MTRAWVSGFRTKGRNGPQLLHPGEWQESTGRPRVLIENPDGADLWAHAEILREAGYDVALCHGPSKPTERESRRRRLRYDNPGEPQHDEKRTLCPLVVEGRCSLVEGADLVVSTTALTDSREILGALSSGGSAALVVEGPAGTLERDGGGAAASIPFPVTEGRLLTAVETALASRTGA